MKNNNTSLVYGVKKTNLMAIMPFDLFINTLAIILVNIMYHFKLAIMLAFIVNYQNKIISL